MVKLGVLVKALFASDLIFAAFSFSSSVTSLRLSFDKAGEGGGDVAGVEIAGVDGKEVSLISV